MDGSRILNVDETSFESGKKSTEVIALRGSRNVWHTDPTINFHLFIVACVCAAGFVVPPLFILPGERVDSKILEACQYLPGAAVTTTERVHERESFREMATVFSDAVPVEVKRTLLLVMDGCASHLSKNIVDTSERLRIVLVCLPANGTHFLQPLDVAVFATFKLRLKCQIDALVTGNGEGPISNPRSLQLASLAWICSNVEKNITSGLKGCGIYPLSKVNMSAKLTNFQRNGAPVPVKRAAWIRVKEAVQQDVLTLPPPRQTSAKKRKTTVSGRILTRELFETEAESVKKMRKQRNPKAQAKCDEVLYVAVVLHL